MGKRASHAPGQAADSCRSGRAVLALATAAKALADAAIALLGEDGATLSHSLTHSRGPEKPPVTRKPKPATVRKVIDEFLASKEKALRSDRYLRQLRVVLSSFAQGRSKTLLADVALEDVEKWIFGQGWKGRTMKGYLSDVKTLFHFAQRRGYVSSSAAVEVEVPAGAPDHSAPGIHTPDQVAQVLDAVRLVNLDVMRHLAVRYFAGVRSAEAHRLTEEDILLDQGFIRIPAVKAKTRRRRLVKIQPNLAAWLALGGELRPLGEMTVRKIVRRTGVPWVKNATRHSFVSYHLAAWENAGKTALEAGHSEQMLFAHYRALVTSDQAKAYWAIVPSYLA